MQVEIGDVFINTVIWIIIIAWGFARVVEVWLNVIERIEKRLREHNKENRKNATVKK